jgi:hypothetical protein
MEEHMARFSITLGETQFTAGHCHKCAHLELAVAVEAQTRAAAVEQVREELCGSEHTVELDGLTAVLTITHDDNLLGARSVKVMED